MEQLPDSTDWIPTSLPAFEPLEAALRCEVCKEFFENPVITTCSHTFCSLCIRRCISHDGECPACRSKCQADKLVANVSVREIVSRFRDARPKVLALAQQNNDPTPSRASKKRKQADAEIEEPGSQRVTRARSSRTSSQRGNGMPDAPLEVADSEDDGDADFVPDEIPEGMVACPQCNMPMKEELVWSHISPGGSCPGEPNAAGSRKSKTRLNVFAQSPSKRQRKDDSPAPGKLSGLNYAIMKETPLKKKLQELGIPAWGRKDILIRRHQEWVNLWNSNLDASEDGRRTKRELLRQLDEWEKARGGRANVKEATVMRKDYDAKSHIDTHKTEFDKLIAAAREKRQPRKVNSEEESGAHEKTADAEPHQVAPDTEMVNPHPEQLPQNGTVNPYEHNESALSVIRDKVQETNLNGAIQPPSSLDEASPSQSASQQQTESTTTGIINPFVSPSKKLPMFSLPENPIVDVENGPATDP